MTRTAVVTVASRARAAHVDRQRAFLGELARPDLVRVEAWLDAEPPGVEGGIITVHVPPGSEGLRVGEGRNAAAAAALEAGAEVLVFLDADCLAGAELVKTYERVVVASPDAVVCGPVTYLPEGAVPAGVADLPPLTRPHPARPNPPRGTTVPAVAAEYDLFWSLSFALSAAAWESSRGFSADYQGYGAEDTDFAWTLRARGVPLLWAGGAHAYHQWHPTSNPPWQHLDDILRNGAAFARRWGSWPMGGWLQKFESAGAIAWDGTSWHRTGNPPA